mmetsp:Transcript_62768/g.149775  ORF Transcript_62768/g.149775 Transcript_62768/m.149775 type:complete len:120 (+) Transcript_62768:570-929(+)
MQQPVIRIKLQLRAVLANSPATSTRNIVRLAEAPGDGFTLAELVAIKPPPPTVGLFCPFTLVEAYPTQSLLFTDEVAKQIPILSRVDRDETAPFSRTPCTRIAPRGGILGEESHAMSIM